MPALMTRYANARKIYSPSQDDQESYGVQPTSFSAPEDHANPDEPSKDTLVQQAKEKEIEAQKAEAKEYGMKKGGFINGKQKPNEGDNKMVPMQTGEYVLPRKTVKHIGKGALDSLVTKTNGKPPRGSKEKGFLVGGDGIDPDLMKRTEKNTMSFNPAARPIDNAEFLAPPEVLTPEKARWGAALKNTMERKEPELAKGDVGLKKMGPNDLSRLSNGALPGGKSKLTDGIFAQGKDSEGGYENTMVGSPLKHNSAALARLNSKLVGAPAANYNAVAEDKYNNEVAAARRAEEIDKNYQANRDVVQIKKDMQRAGFSGSVDGHELNALAVDAHKKQQEANKGALEAKTSMANTHEQAASRIQQATLAADARKENATARLEDVKLRREEMADRRKEGALTREHASIEGAKIRSADAKAKRESDRRAQALRAATNKDGTVDEQLAARLDDNMKKQEEGYTMVPDQPEVPAHKEGGFLGFGGTKVPLKKATTKWIPPAGGALASKSAATDPVEAEMKRRGLI